MKTFSLSQLPETKVVAFSKITDLYKSPFPGQRSHRLHLKEATYLTTDEDLWGDQLVFHSVMYPVGDSQNPSIVHKLCDGYTRVLAVLEGHKSMPKQVVLITHTAPNYEAAYALYSQFNSTKASKKNKHSVQSGVREASHERGTPNVDCFNSGLLTRGSLTSGMLYSGIAGADVRKKTSRAFDSLTFLDKMGLNAGTESVGVMAAYINIVERDRTNRPKDVRKFIRLVNFEGELEVDKPEDNAVILGRDFHNDRRMKKTCSGGSNVKTIRDRMLAYYQLFLDIKDEVPNAKLRLDMDLGMFKLCA
jgi:hypothetical protein